MLMNDKIIFDRYYCIHSAERNKVQERKKYGALYFTASYFHTRKSFRFYARSGQTSVSHYYHVLCVAPGNEHM